MMNRLSWEVMSVRLEIVEIRAMDVFCSCNNELFIMGHCITYLKVFLSI